MHTALMSSNFLNKLEESTGLLSLGKNEEKPGSDVIKTKRQYKRENPGANVQFLKNARN